MAMAIEIIPTEPKVLSYERILESTVSIGIETIEIYDDRTETYLKTNDSIFNDRYTIHFSGVSFFLKKKELDPVDPPEEYLEKQGSELDRKKIACMWNSVGYSYDLSPDDKHKWDSDCYIWLIFVLSKSLSGYINHYSGDFTRCSGGLYSPEDFLGACGLKIQ